MRALELQRPACRGLPALPETPAVALKNCVANHVGLGQPNSEVACRAVALCEGWEESLTINKESIEFRDVSTCST